MLDSSLMDCSNMGLLDNNFIEQNYSYISGGRRNARRGRNENYSNAVSAETVNAGIGAATSIAGAFASKQPNASKQAARAQKKEFKSACGRKPILKKKQGAWQDCVNKYVASKNPAPVTAPVADTTPSPAADYGASRTSSGNGSDEKKFYQKPLFIATAVVVVLAGGFLLYKKFSSKAPVAIPAV